MHPEHAILFKAKEININKKVQNSNLAVSDRKAVLWVQVYLNALSRYFSDQVEKMPLLKITMGNIRRELYKYHDVAIGHAITKYFAAVHKGWEREKIGFFASPPDEEDFSTSYWKVSGRSNGDVVLFFQNHLILICMYYYEHVESQEEILTLLVKKYKEYLDDKTAVFNFYTISSQLRFENAYY